MEEKELIEEVANAASGEAVLEPIVDEAAHVKPWVSVFLLAILALIWGSSFILMKKGLIALTPLEVSNLRIFTAFCVLGPFAALRLRSLPRRDWGPVMLSGFTGSYIPAFLFSWAGAHLSSAVSGSLNALSPLFTVLVGAAFFATSVSKRAFWGIMVGLLGALALSLSKAASTGFELDVWALPVVAATILYAVNLNVIKVTLKDVDSFSISSVSMLAIGTLATIVLFGFTGFSQKLANPPEGFWFAVGSIVTLGLFSTAIALVLYNRLIKFTSAVVASSVTYLMPIVSVAWGVLDGEHMMAYHYFGLAAIIGGVFLVNKK